MINIVAAHDKNFAIGKDGHLPWPRMGADIARLHALTNRQTIVMGQSTYQEYKDVNQAFNVDKVYVISRSFALLPDATILSGLEEVSKLAEKETVWVIGGASIFKQLFDTVEYMYLTVIDGEFEADTYFPQYSYDTWYVVEEVQHSADLDNPYPYTFLTLQRKR